MNVELGLAESVWKAFCLNGLEIVGLLLERFIPNASLPELQLFAFADLFPFSRQLVVGGRIISLPALKYRRSGAVVQGMGNFSVCTAAGIVIYITLNRTFLCCPSQYPSKVQFNLNLCGSLAFLS